ncbi:MAG: hypothetical protein Kow0074_02410 [Candidatus Zixiibacteriota bacterium]
MAATLKKELGITPKLIEGGGGEFEVTVDGKLIFSKKKLKRFPEHEEILEAIGQ